MKYQKGQSLFEVLIAMAISALIIVTLVSMVSLATRNAVYSKNQSIATRYAQETIEWLRQQRDTDTAVFINNTLTPKWCMVSLSWSKSGACGQSDVITGSDFIREVEFSDAGASKTLITAQVKIVWTDAQGLHEVVSSTNFSDWRQR